MFLKPRSRPEVYDQLYRLASIILKRVNACAACPIGCATQRGTKSWCCSGCPHLGPQGCTVESLYCKLWVCQEWAEEYPSSFKANHGVNQFYRNRLEKLFRIAAHYRILMMRGSKGQAILYGLTQHSKYIYYRDHDERQA